MSRTPTLDASEEIDFLELFSTLWNRRKFIILTTFSGAVLMFVLNFFLPKIYLSEASFFYKSDSLSVNPLGSYSGLLGGANSQLEDQIEEIVKSKSMETFLVNKTEENFPDFFPADLEWEEKVGKLNLEKKLKIFKNKRSLFQMEFSSRDAALSFFIVDTTLKQINVFNEELELSEQSKIITILDYPEIQKIPERPKKLLNIAVAIVMFFMASVFVVFFQDNKKKKTLLI